MSPTHKNNDEPADAESASSAKERQAPSRQSSPRRNRIGPRDSFWYSKAKILIVMLIGAILVTGYVYLEQNVFSANRPIEFRDAATDKIDQAERNGSIVILLIGHFPDSSEVGEIIKRLDVAPVRKEVHRQMTYCSVVKLEAESAEEKPNRDWLAGKVESQTIEEFSQPMVLILYKKADRPQLISLRGNPVRELESLLNEIRRR